MKKFFISAFIFFIISSDCKKIEEKYNLNDLFPLEVGNKFFYKYYYRSYSSFSDLSQRYRIEGNEIWTVISKEKKREITEYIIERNLNGLHSTALLVSEISNRISYLTITEDNSSSQLNFTLRGIISLKRWSTNDSIIISPPCNTCQKGMIMFRSNNGIAMFSCVNGPIIEAETESLFLDSLRVAR